MPISFLVILAANMYVALVVHEAGHFATAKLLRYRVTEVRLGAPILLRFRRFPFDVGLGLFPVGEVRTERNPPPAAGMLLSVAGIFANFMAAGIAVWLAHFSVWLHGQGSLFWFLMTAVHVQSLYGVCCFAASGDMRQFRAYLRDFHER